MGRGAASPMDMKATFESSSSRPRKLSREAVPVIRSSSCLRHCCNLCSHASTTLQVQALLRTRDRRPHMPRSFLGLPSPHPLRSRRQCRARLRHQLVREAPRRVHRAGLPTRTGSRSQHPSIPPSDLSTGLRARRRMRTRLATKPYRRARQHQVPRARQSRHRKLGRPHNRHLRNRAIARFRCRHMCSRWQRRRQLTNNHRKRLRSRRRRPRRRTRQRQHRIRPSRATRRRLNRCQTRKDI